jgi:uncharacterized protein YjiS (DUF1127 family)
MDQLRALVGKGSQSQPVCTYGQQSGAIRKGMVIIMTMATQLFAYFIRLPKLRIWHAFGQGARRRRATLDLIHSSRHLLRDIGAMEENFIDRGK